VLRVVIGETVDLDGCDGVVVGRRAQRTRTRGGVLGREGGPTPVRTSRKLWRLLGSARRTRTLHASQPRPGSRAGAPDTACRQSPRELGQGRTMAGSLA